MIRYKKHQITDEKSPLKGLWYAHPVIEETFDIENVFYMLSQIQTYFRETDANDTFLFHSRIYHSTKSIANRVPFSKSRFTFLSKISFRYLGCNPKPGRTERTFRSVMTSPDFMSSDT